MDWRGVRTLAIVLIAALWLLSSALAWPLNHDESQYVAGAVLARNGRVFADFLSLQPPLYTWQMAPVTAAWPGHVVTSLRLANASLALVTLWIVWAVQRRLGVPARLAIGTTALLLASDAFLFGASVARNDMLSTTLVALSVPPALDAVRSGRARLWGLAGLCLGLATAAKLLAAPLAGALFVVALLEDRGKAVPRSALAVVGGALLGLVPVLLAALHAPEALLYGVFTFGFTAPADWYQRTAQGFDLTIVGKLLALASFLLAGPSAVGLALVARRLRLRTMTQTERMLAALLGAALVAAVLPTPVHRQYLQPALPLLAMLGGTIAAQSDLRRRWTVAAAAAAVIGASSAMLNLVAAVEGGAPALQADRDARQVARMLPAGRLASFSLERLASSGRPLDPRFATGPFVFRSGRLLGDAQARRLTVLTPAILYAALDASPPAALLTGYESTWLGGVAPPDVALDGWARSRGYRARRMPDGIGRLYIRASLR